MKFKKLFTLITSFFCLFSFLTGCQQTPTNNEAENNQLNTEIAEKTEIRIGGTSISQVTYEAIQPIYEAMGYKTEFIMFDSNPVVLEACNSGDTDIAIGQHIKFVENFNKNKNGDLAMAKPYGHYTGIGLYSEKYTSVDEFPEGSQIAIMNDPMNMGIALHILENAGLIKLKKDIEFPTIGDIEENPKNLQIIDMEQAQTVTALQDMAGACIFFTHMSNAGKDPSTYIARDSDMIHIPMGVIVKNANAEAKWVTDFAKCYREKEVQDKINARFPGVFEFYTSDEQAIK